MILALRLLFGVVLVTMLAVTTWASTRCPLFAVPREVFTHPWFLATLCDTYWGFITFFVWVCYKQTSLVARGAWFVAIMLLGNIAMAVYCLNELRSVRRDADLVTLLTCRREGASVTGFVLAALGIGVTAFAAASG